MSSIDYRQLDYGQWNFLQRLFRGFVKVLMKLMARIEVEGVEQIPAQGRKSASTTGGSCAGCPYGSALDR
jgi:hypothetical protein